MSFWTEMKAGAGIALASTASLFPACAGLAALTLGITLIKDALYESTHRSTTTQLINAANGALTTGATLIAHSLSACAPGGGFVLIMAEQAFSTAVELLAGQCAEQPRNAAPGA